MRGSKAAAGEEPVVIATGPRPRPTPTASRNSPTFGYCSYLQTPALHPKELRHPARTPRGRYGSRQPEVAETQPSSGVPTTGAPTVGIHRPIG